MGLDAAYGIGSLKPGICTSTTRPASPFTGQTIYETDTTLAKVWNGTAWVEYPPGKADIASPTFTGTPAAPTATAGTNTTQIATMASRPWNMAWGHLGSSTLETSFATTNPHTTYQDEGLSTSVTYAANRKLRITLSVRPYTNGGTNFVGYRVLRGSTVVAVWGFGYPDISNTEAPAKTVVFVMTTPGTGATETFKVQIQGASNTAVTSYGQSWTAADGGRQFIIEDIGPA
jgi:hypothetical protein